MDDRSPQERPAVSLLLTPTDTSTLKQLWLQEKTTEFPFNEFRLNGKPESLKTFVDQFLKEDGVINFDRLIWTSKNSFVRVSVWKLRHELPGVYQNHRFRLCLETDSRIFSLNIYSTTPEDAMSCLDFLVGLHDDHFRKMELSEHHNIIAGGRPRLCTLTCWLLEKVLLQSTKRKHVFRDMIFTPDQSRALATSGTKTDIELIRFEFEDDGEVFLEALATRADPQTGLVKLSIRERLPFGEGILVLLLDKLKSLSLQCIHLEGEDACRAVAVAELQYLNLSNCELGDGGVSLVESIREGRGPKELDLYSTRHYENDWHPFDSIERFTSFLNALRGNTYLERLDLSRFYFLEQGILDAFAAALFENKGLVHLGLQNCHLAETCFRELLRAISAHSSLRMLALTGISISTMDATEATKAVAEMLSVNKQLEEIRVSNSFSFPFDMAAWDELVTPRLEYNIYRKRFPPIQNIRVPSTLAAVMARALSHISNRSSPAFMLLRQNSDILSIYSLRVDPQIATSSGKRSRSPSSDGREVSNFGAGNWT
jgi:hypothetical protein